MKKVEKAVIEGIRKTRTKVTKIEKKTTLSRDEIIATLFSPDNEDQTKEFDYFLFIGFSCKILRKDRKWTQLQMAEKCNVSRYRISRFERGEFGVGEDMIHRVCFAFDMTLEKYLELAKVFQNGFYDLNPEFATRKLV